ncbi:MAG TPA: YifB family Mg chelatase-like AAA ATPase [Myxococcota bacterium]|jgi:magnesium chelatase family protein|nr:YifB family Mg chelatase-like AAA ATPase [Myxococcota bacterium]
MTSGSSVVSRARGAALVGVDGHPVEVEVRLSSQLPRIDLVGLPEAAVRESGARVRAAIAASGLRFPERRVTVNLAPASLRKGGAGLDLPIALGILAAAGDVDAERLTGLGLFGELALDGRLRAVPGALALTLALRDAGVAEVIVPEASAAEAALAPGISVLPAPDLRATLVHLRGEAPLVPASTPRLAPAVAPSLDLADVRGQEHAKRALVVAAAGGHALLLVGPPGAGKTMLAKRLPGLLPPLDFEEAVDVLRIHGAVSRTAVARGEGSLAAERPFRSPHHSASPAGILGGGSPPRPGEVSLAHRGVLFLDELPEFERRVLEALRQVLEDRAIVLARARHSCVLPAHFQLVAAANPCPCGFRLSRERDCRCDDGAIARYAARLSGPLLDRIDLQVRVPSVPWRELEEVRPGRSSADARHAVVSAVARQERRLSRVMPGARRNAEIPDGVLDGLVDAAPEARALLGRAVDRLRLSARAARRVLRVARTVADLGGETRVGPAEIAEALAFRQGMEP